MDVGDVVGGWRSEQGDIAIAPGVFGSDEGFVS
jgi:hypothetical protein